MRKLLSILLLITLYGCGGERVLFDTNPEYLKPVPGIFKLGAHSVVRNQEAVLTFFDKHEAEYQEHGVITILDEDHRGKGRFILDYDNFRELETMKVQVRNDDGMIVGRYTIKDADDYSASGSNFFTDVRVKVIEAYHYSYPYTIEYEYKYKYTGTLNLPGWYPKSYSQSVGQASFEIIDFTKGGLRYYSRNIEESPAVNEYAEYTSTKWSMNMDLARQHEVYSPPYTEIFPNVLTSASLFEVGGSSGNASNWQLFGEWYYQLSEGKRKLPETAKTEINQLITGVENEREKIIKLYKYMQEQTRYVSIQLGLGGWEPYSAEFVFQNKYGDCKALVNFMHAILEYVGIKAEPALIRNGLNAPGVIADFPSNQFNHVVLRVSLENGEIMWLECTSKYIKPGRIGVGNEGKKALVVNSAGGEIIETETSSPDANNAHRIMKIELLENGSANISSTLWNEGAMDDDMLHKLKPISPKKREEWLEESIGLNDFNLQSHEFFGLEEGGSETGYKLKMKTRNFASSSAKRLFIPLNALNQWNIYMPDEEFRATALQLPYRFTEIDSTIFELPAGYKIESLPESEKVETDFGTFTLNVFEKEDKVYFKRELMIVEKTVPKENYEDFKSFFTTVNKMDGSQFVIVKE